MYLWRPAPTVAVSRVVGVLTPEAARALEARPTKLSWIEILSLRAMVAACLLAAGAAAANYSTLSRLFADETPPVDDPVAALVAIAS